MATQVPWDRLLKYGEAVMNAARQAWERVKSWRAEREASPALPAPSEEQRGSLTVEQLSEAMASQSELTKRLAEQASDMTEALSQLGLRLSQIEQQNKEQIARMRAALAGQAARSRWAMTVAALALVLAGLLAVLPYLSRYL